MPRGYTSYPTLKDGRGVAARLGHSPNEWGGGRNAKRAGKRKLLFRLGDVAPLGGVAGATEIVLDAITENSCSAPTLLSRILLRA